MASLYYEGCRRIMRAAAGNAGRSFFCPISDFFVIEFVTLRRPMCRECPRAVARNGSRVWERVLWLEFSTKSCCIPAWSHSSRGLLCLRRRPGYAEAVIEFEVGAGLRQRRTARE